MIRYANVAGVLQEPRAGLKGLCPGCNAPVIAKCGTIKIRHWAHQRSLDCDPWWGPITQWHLDWQNQYPVEWREMILRDEKSPAFHRADIHTPHGLTIEFQHSHLNPNDRAAREGFYHDLVWVVDGTRLKQDYPHFCKGQNQMMPAGKAGIYHVYDPEKCLPSSWLRSSVPVIFDFKGQEVLNEPAGLREPLFCLFPVRVGRRATLARITRSAFIKNTINGEWSVRARIIMKELMEDKQEWDRQEEASENSWQMHKLQMRGWHRGFENRGEKR